MSMPSKPTGAEKVMISPLVRQLLDAHEPITFSKSQGRLKTALFERDALFLLKVSSVVTLIRRAVIVVFYDAKNSAGARQLADCLLHHSNSALMAIRHCRMI